MYDIDKIMNAQDTAALIADPNDDDTIVRVANKIIAAHNEVVPLMRKLQKSDAAWVGIPLKDRFALYAMVDFDKRVTEEGGPVEPGRVVKLWFEAIAEMSKFAVDVHREAWATATDGKVIPLVPGRRQ